MKEKKTFADAALNLVKKGSHYKTNFTDLDEMVYMLDSIFISKATTEKELSLIYKSVLAKFFGGEVIQTPDGQYKLFARIDLNSIRSRYTVSIYNGETEYRYRACYRFKMKKEITAKIEARKKDLITE